MTFVKTALFHKAGEGSGGGGGGDQHNLGWYATESALTTAHATATDGDWAIVGATDTVWVWDSDSTGWKDTGAAGIELPDQTGHSGEFLITNGTSVSWSDKPLVNNATGTNSLAVGPSSTATGNYSTAIGNGASSSGNSCVVIGSGSGATKEGSVVIGSTYVQPNRCTVIGRFQDNVPNNSIAINCSSTAKNLSGQPAGFWLSFDQNNNYHIVDSNGLIPTARFTTDPSADGTYYPTLTISSGTPTRSWSTINALVNNTTSSNSLAIGNLATASTSNSVVVGVGSYVQGGSGSTVVVGYNSYATTEGTAIGQHSQATKTGCIAIGSNAVSTAARAIQIGYGTNSESGTLSVGLFHNGQFPNYKLLDSDGTIPTDRLTKVNSTITLTAAGWSSNTQTVSVSGVTSTSVVLVAPDPSDTADYVSAGILCTSQTTDSLTFTATTTPTSDIDVNIVCL